MPVFQCAISKRIVWRGKDEEMTNIYTAKHDDPSQGRFEQLRDTLVAYERPRFSPAFVFTSFRIWGPIVVPGDGISEKPDKALSETQLIGDILGTGEATTQPAMYTELATVFRQYIGRAPVTGRKRYLRKYYHSAMNKPLLQREIHEGAAIQQSTRTEMANEYNQNITDKLTPLGWVECAMNGDTPQDKVEVIPNLHIRQLR
jgi:hypothetical protein